VSGLEGLREWLRVPRGLSLPAWVSARLGTSVAGELEARRGVPLERAVFAVVDLETTGLSPKRCRILEIGAVVLRGADVLARFETLVDVGQPLPWGITALTGIHDELLAGAPPEGQALASLAALLERHGVEAVVAHNARFDRGFLARARRARTSGPSRCRPSCARCAPRAGWCARRATGSTPWSRSCRSRTARDTARSATRR